MTALHSNIHDPEGRFLLALLMLMPDRDAILETIRLQFPDVEPLATIETWVAGMSGKTIGFEFNDQNRLIFRSLLEDLLQRLRSEFPADAVHAYRDRLLDYAKQLARSYLFHPLFLKSPLREARAA